MAVVTIGGVILSAVFTLFLIPVIYVKLDRRSGGRFRLQSCTAFAAASAA
jgi:hypothetical protein